MPKAKIREPQLTRFQQMQIEQPWCVYCGGTTPGTSADHGPPRIAFNAKRRPKGLEFMSCDDCADGSRRVDQVAALFARFYSVTPGNSEHRREIGKLFRGIANNEPEVLKEMQVEKVLRDADHPVRKSFPAAKAVFTFGPIAASYIAAFGARLALALHYEKTHQIVPRTGGVCAFSRSNNTLVEEGVPDQFIQLLGPPEALEQGKFSARDQFEYASRVEDNGARSAHFIAFRLSFAIQAFVVRDFTEVAKFVGVAPHNVFRPGFLKNWQSPFI
ncbi:MAG: hypothetical protein ACOY4R_03945 [Pseudomonadota bacterium]